MQGAVISPNRMVKGNRAKALRIEPRRWGEFHALDH
jgi:hypothetical protein